MALQLVGVKRKGEDLEQDQPQKKLKNSKELIDLPEDCWKAIFEYLTLEAASSLYYASKSFRQVHSRLVAHYCNRVHGLSTDLVQLLPTSVIKRISNIEIILLFEKAISYAEAKNYEDLTMALKKIQLRAQMDQTIFIVLNTMPKNLIEDKHLKSVYYYDFYRSIQEVHEDIPDQTGEVRQRSKLVWLGKDRRYINVTSEYQSIYNRNAEEGWLRFKVTVVLKQLGAENGHDKTIVFEFMKDPSVFNIKGHTIEQCIFEDDSYEKRGLFNEDDIRKVMDWLKVDLIDNENSSKTFMKVLLNLVFNQQMTIVRDDEGQAVDYENIKFDKYEDECLQDEELEELTEMYNEEIKEFNGDIVKEISHLMQFYLSGVKNWNAKTRFVVKRLLLKLGFIHSINRTDFSSNQAEEELLDLFARATMDSCETKLASFFMPGTENSEAIIVHYIDNEVYMKLHPKNGTSERAYFQVYYENSPNEVHNGVGCTVGFGSDDLHFNSSKGLKAAYDLAFQTSFERMKLKHVTMNDWLEFFLTYTSIAELEDEEDEDQDDGEEVF